MPYSVTSTPDFANFLVKYVRAGLLETLRAGLPWLPDGAVSWDTYQRGTSDTYVLGGVSDLSDIQQAHNADEITNPPVEALESFTQEFSTTEFARSVGWSATMERRMPFPMGSTIAERVRRAVEVLFDSVARDIWLAGATGLPQFGSTTATLTRNTLVDIATILRGLDVPTLPDGTFGLIVNPAAIGDLLKETGDQSISALLSPSTDEVTRTGVVGTINGVKLITSSRVPVGAGPGYVSEGVAFGANALAFADRTSINVYTIMPSPSIADPTARRGVSSYVARVGGALIKREKVSGGAASFNAISVNMKAAAPTTTAQP